MPKRTFPALAASLIEHGLSPNTPALIAENVGHPDQSIVRSTVAELAAQLHAGFSTKPALILYGPLMDAE
jgi:uroporphyrin-III C-methyltransferase